MGSYASQGRVAEFVRRGDEGGECDEERWKEGQAGEGGGVGSAEVRRAEKEVQEREDGGADEEVKRRRQDWIRESFGVGDTKTLLALQLDQVLGLLLTCIHSSFLSHSTKRASCC